MVDTDAVAATPSTLVTRDEANAILSERYPTDEELVRFPLAEQLLREIPFVDPRYGGQNGGQRGHIEQVIEGINILLSKHPERIVKQWAVEKPFQDAIIFEGAYQQIFSKERAPESSAYCRFESTKERDSFFRLLALYHDIGKAVITERHPLVGWHLIKDVYATQVAESLWPLLLGRPYDEWKRDLDAAQNNIDRITTPREQRLLKIFNAVVRYHDYFGILSTGEGSLPVMVDLVDLRGVDPKDAQELFSVLMIMNLADVYGSVSEVLPQKVNVCCDDWRVLCSMISAPDVGGDRSRFFDRLRSHTQTPRAAIERLRRLMFEGAPDKWQDEIGYDIVEQIFREATLSRLYPFTKNFALFCKLDYCLAFKRMLMSTAYDEKAGLSDPINVMITILAELEKRYGDLCQRSDGTWRRIGFEMAGLTRRPNTHKDATMRTKSRIGETISSLLLRPSGLGKEWAVSECSVWFMEE